MIDHSGNLIDLPYFGCYAGCSRNYCYLFGTEIPEGIYFGLILIGVLFIFSIILILLAKFRKGGIFGVPKDLQ